MMSTARLAMILCTGLLTAALVRAQDYPAKSVRVLAPWPPGASNVNVARLVAKKWSENTRQQFIVADRSGASGTPSAEVFASTEPDGDTLMIRSATRIHSRSFPRTR